MLYKKRHQGAYSQDKACLMFSQACLGQTGDLEFGNAPLHNAYLLKSFPCYTLARILKLIKDTVFLDDTWLLFFKDKEKHNNLREIYHCHNE